MSKSIKRLLSIMMAVVLLIGSMPVSAFAAETDSAEVAPSSKKFPSSKKLSRKNSSSKRSSRKNPSSKRSSRKNPSSKKSSRKNPSSKKSLRKNLSSKKSSRKNPSSKRSSKNPLWPIPICSRSMTCRYRQMHWVETVPSVLTFITA